MAKVKRKDVVPKVWSTNDLETDQETISIIVWIVNIKGVNRIYKQMNQSWPRFSLPTLPDDDKEISTFDEDQYLQLDNDSDFERIWEALNISVKN